MRTATAGPTYGSDGSAGWHHIAQLVEFGQATPRAKQACCRTAFRLPATCLPGGPDVALRTGAAEVAVTVRCLGAGAAGMQCNLPVRPGAAFCRRPGLVAHLLVLWLE